MDEFKTEKVCNHTEMYMLDCSCPGISEHSTLPCFLMENNPSPILSKIITRGRFLGDYFGIFSRIYTFFHEDSRSISIDPADNAQIIVLSGRSISTITLIFGDKEHRDCGDQDDGNDSDCHDFLIQEITTASI